MRKLMWFTLGFAAACAYCAYTWSCDGLILPAVVFAVLFAGAVASSQWVKELKIAAAVCLGISLGLVWFQGYYEFYLTSAAAMDRQRSEVTVHCTNYSVPTDYGTAVEGFLYLDGKPYQGKFYVNHAVEMEPGDILSGGFELRVTTEDGEKGATYHQGKGMFLLGYQETDAQLLKTEDVPFWACPAILRQHIVNYLERTFPQDTAGFAKALLLGDRTDIDYKLNSDFKVSGIMHIIAVSGLHVTILFTLINILCLKRRWLVGLLGIPALILFAAVAGFTPSIIRACIMQCLMIGAMLMNKEYDGPTELAFASLVMLVANPLTITSVSFQLSVGCMIGIFLFRQPIYDWIGQKLKCEKNRSFFGVKRWFAGSVSVTLSAISLTTPLSAYYFGAVSLVGVLTNLLTLWAVSIIFYGIIFTCITGAAFPSVGVFAAGIISWLIRLVLLIARTLASFPLAAVYTRSVYITAWLVFCYILLALFLLSKERKPFLLAGCLMFGLLLSVAASYLEHRTDNCRMTVLNVGQGQSIILQSDGKTYLVDCGGDYDSDAADLAAETLLSQGINRVDGLILTHFDRDHAGGAGFFLTRIPTQSVYVPAFADESQLEALGDNHIVQIDEDIEILFENTSISILESPISNSGNEGSLAVLFRRGNCDILITGDRSGVGERLLLKQNQIPQLDVLVAGHHGAQDSTCEELLAATRPNVVAISVGQNSYGHPAPEVLERLERYGCIVYRTDLHGNITFRR